jgi:hypothetical protein
MSKPLMPCGRQPKDFELFTCLKKYKKLCEPLKHYYYVDVLENQKDFIAGLTHNFIADTHRILGAPLSTSVLHNVIRKSCKVS